MHNFKSYTMKSKQLITLLILIWSTIYVSWAGGPQETGTHSDIRWWNQTNLAGQGLQIVSEQKFNASALHYTIDMLDDGVKREQRHGTIVDKSDFTTLCIDSNHMGLGCEDSWGRIPQEYTLLPGNKSYSFSFIIKPVMHAFPEIKGGYQIMP